MNAVRLTPRIVDPGAPSVPLLVANYSPGPAIAVFGIGFAIGVGFAIFHPDVHFRVMMAAVGAVMGLLLAILIVLQNAMHVRTVRIDENYAGLRFVAPIALDILFWAIGVVGLVPGFVVMSGGGSQRGGIAFIVLSSIFVAWIAQQFWALRTPRGLTLTETGLIGVRGSASVSSTWDGVTGVELVYVRGARIVLHLRDGRTVTLDPRYTGSDPNVLATIVDYFLRHPADRAALADPRAAIALVESARAK